MAPWGAIIRVAMQVGMTALNAILKALPEAYAAGRQGEECSCASPGAPEWRASDLAAS